MFLSIAFAAVGVLGGLYNFTVSVLGLQNGPLCRVLLVWTTPFKNMYVNFLMPFMFVSEVEVIIKLLFFMQ